MIGAQRFIEQGAIRAVVLWNITFTRVSNNNPIQHVGNAAFLYELTTNTDNIRMKLLLTKRRRRTKKTQSDILYR
jgi:hypothetical protein